MLRRQKMVFPCRVEGWLDMCEPIAGSKRIPNPEELTWEPHFCVLLQDDQTFTAYKSEELAFCDSLLADLPRIRLGSSNGGLRAGLHHSSMPPSVPEEPELDPMDPDLDTVSLHAVNAQPLIGESNNKSFSLPRGLSVDLRHKNPHRQFVRSASHTPDTSYEKACRRGSAPSTPILGGSRAPTSGGSSSSRGAFANFFSKRSFRANPLKRTKSVTKLERGKNTPDGNDPNGLRTSRSHESLLAGTGGGRAVSQLELGSGGEVQAVHPSVLSRPHCFQLSLPPDGQPRFFSCSSQEECDKWVHSLRSCMAGNETPSSPRTDRSLRIWVLEAKGITSPGGKRRHSQPLRCEIYLDDNLWAKTAAKGCRSPEVGTNKGAKTELGTGAFWGELFDFAALPPIQMLKLKLLREPAKAQRNGTYKPTVIGTVQIPIRDISSRYFTEKWYPVDINDKPGREVPSLRVKCRFQAIHILPAAVYIDFLTFLKTDYKKICEILEPAIGVKAKEDIATALVLALQHEGLAKPFLADVVMLDVERVDDQRLTFRGNSLATKAMEAYLKLTGDRYLRQTLVDVVDAVANADCEVDPLRVTGGASALAKQQRALRQAVELAWSRVLNSARIFPVELRECFAAFRERLSLAGRDDVADHLISASVFLRFLCPAILSPSLFNITNEYPNEKAARNLTLVAKTLQTLANFTRFQGKENFMEFMNDFLEREAPAMKQFLRDISTRTSDEDLRGLRRHSQLEFDGHIDLGKQLSILANLLSECLNKVSSSKLQELDPLTRILDDLHLQQRGGPMRSGSTPQSPDSLQNNIFRFNDPTVHNSNTNLNSSAATTPTSSPFEPQPLTPQLKPQLSQQYIHVPNTSEPTAIRSNTLPRNGHQVTLTIPGAELELEPARAFVSKSPCTPRRTGPNEQDLSQLSDLLRYADDSAKGSNVSISQLSNVASSGYQSFAYSQSSSPVDHPNGIHHRQNAHPRLGLKSQGLAFTNPVYSADFGPKRRLESSSSEERLSEVDKNKEEVNEKRRTPRTNPTVTYRKGYGVVSEPERRITPQRNESIEFDNHKNYICVARDVRNNGFEGPYFSRDLTDRNHRHENPHNIHPTPHDHSHNARWRLAHRRLSLDLTDSSSDGESNVTANAATRVFHTTGRVGSGAERYQREIERLQAAVDVLRRKLERAELGSSSPELEAHDSDAKMRSIIQRLISVEEELRREQHKMSLALSHKQRVIEAQEHQIAALDAANNRLLSALSTLKHRYTASSANQHNQSRTEDNDNGNNVGDVRTSSC